MAVSIIEYRKFVESSRERPERKSTAIAAIDVYERLHDAMSFTREAIDPIVEAAKSPYRMVWDIGVEFLMRLAETHTTAQDAILEVFGSPRVSERFQIVASLGKRLPKPLCIQVITAGLNDRGNRVREKAAAAADRLELSELAPLLEQRLAIEDHPNARKSLQFHLAMLTDGYLLEPRDDGTYKLTFRMQRGGWCGVSVSKDQCNVESIQRIIDDRNSNSY